MCRHRNSEGGARCASGGLSSAAAGQAGEHFAAADLRPRAKEWCMPILSRYDYGGDDGDDDDDYDGNNDDKCGLWKAV